MTIENETYRIFLNAYYVNRRSAVARLELVIYELK